MIAERLESTTYSLNDQLGHSVTLVNGKVGLAEVEQQHLQGATVVCVNDTSTNID